MENTIDFTPRNIPILLTEIDMNKQVNLNGFQATLNIIPDECPFCHVKGAPSPLYANQYGGIARVVFLCHNHECNEIFIGYYTVNTSHGMHFQSCTLTKLSIGKMKEAAFSDCIKSISKNFKEIYNQSFAAEQYKLEQISGGGYRKALEFLIKDYAKQGKNEEEKKKIEKMPLMQCINENITNQNIKNMAKRAVWLGNDETHYERKWEEKDLTDLKKMISATVAWIELEDYTKEVVESMPDPPKQ